MSEIGIFIGKARICSADYEQEIFLSAPLHDHSAVAGVHRVAVRFLRYIVCRQLAALRCLAVKLIFKIGVCELLAKSRDTAL